MTNNVENPIVRKEKPIAGLQIFKRKDGTMGFINGLNDCIAADGLKSISRGEFYFSFEKQDGTMGWMDEFGRIIREGKIKSIEDFRLLNLKD